VRGRSVGRRYTVGQYGYVPLGLHLVFSDKRVTYRWSGHSWRADHPVDAGWTSVTWLTLLTLKTLQQTTNFYLLDILILAVVLITVCLKIKLS